MKLLLSIPIVLVLSACGSSSPTSPSRPVADYGGNWSGTYSITGCTQSGGVALANVCGSLGQTPPYAMSLTQSGANVSGTFRLGSVEFPPTGGQVASDGSLQLNSTSVSSGITIVVSWNLRMTGSQMSGSISQQWSSSQLSGGATVAGTINTAARAAGGMAPARTTGGAMDLTGVAGMAAGR